ncbi:TIGR02234 family membrane protein [Catenulispora subtropica]|uniref:Trp biosynthesis associated, transmembrane protein, Oprn/Chp n=1 Tax=Catenulispora subtropica TaxID=450798 RepID=A0ABP5EPY5_9ACTN
MSNGTNSPEPAAIADDSTADDSTAAESTAAESRAAAESQTAADLVTAAEPHATAESQSAADLVTAAEPHATAESQTAADLVTAAEPHAAAEPSAPATPNAAAAPRTPGSAARRELTTTVLLALLGGVAAWAAAGRVWADGTADQAPSSFAVTATGNDLSAAVTALGLTALAGALALLATRRLARRLVGLLLVAVGVGVVVNAVTARGAGHAAHVLGEKAASKGFASGAVPAHTTSWWLLAVAGGVLVALAGVAAVARGGAWPGMSSRYENAAPAAARPGEASTAKDLWDALDRGEDPTDRADAVAAEGGTRARTITPNR